MIDFVAKSYEENRFDPQKASRSVAELVEARHRCDVHGHFGRRGDRKSSLGLLLDSITGIAAAVIAGIFLYHSWLTSWTDYTAYDVPQTFILPDSSSVTLAPGATLRLQEHKDNRLVQMTGKVYFNVRHDDGAPFRVDAGAGFVKVLGTRFQVDASAASVAEPVEGDSGRSGGCVSVSVVSGRVLFSAAKSSEGLILTKGRNAVLDPASAKPVETTPKHPNPAAWATGEFIYDNTPLPEVISEISDYYGVRLTVGNQSSIEPAVHRLNGEFSTASLYDILSLIDSALGVSLSVE